MREARVAAVDLGASSGRVALGCFSSAGVTLREVHRFPNVPVRVGGSLRWNVLGLLSGVVEGLRAARPDSVGIDSWAVDYGLLDADGELLGNPFCYREPGTAGTVDAVLSDLGAEALYAATGSQLQPFTTLFQLLARRDTAQAAAARTALLIPDLIAYWLGAAPGTEITNASTTQLLDPRTRDWSTALAERLDAPVGLFAPLRQPGERLGRAREVDAELIAVPSHDTAAAVAGVPADGDGWAYVCTGTWALVGVELPAPVITEAARAANFTNEVGVDGTIRFLRNVTGFWLLQECVREWGADAGELIIAAADVPGRRALVDVQDLAFAAPGDMPRRITEAATGVRPETRAEVTRCILDSMALAIGQAVRDAAALSGRPVREVHVVGGGAAGSLFCRLVADACELPVVAGPVEAASWGNVMSQARALGLVEDSLAATRELQRRTLDLPRYEPGGTR